MGSLALGRPKPIPYAVATLSLVAALIHLRVMPEHFEEWWGYRAFLPLLLRWPNQMILLLGIGGNVAVLLLYLLTRTVGIPVCRPRGEMEGAKSTDLCATTSELGSAVALGAVFILTGSFFGEEAPGLDRRGRSPCGLRRTRSLHRPPRRSRELVEQPHD